MDTHQTCVQYIGPISTTKTNRGRTNRCTEAAGHAVFEMNVVRRGSVNGDVRLLKNHVPRTLPWIRKTTTADRVG